MKDVTYNSSLLKDSWNSNETVKPNNFNELSGAVKNVIANANDLAHNYLQQGKQYVAGDIAYSNNLPSWAYLYCVQAGTTAAEEPSFASVNAMGQYITDGTVKWIVDDIRFNMPVGVVFYDSYLHAGCVKYNGATVQRSDYIRIAKIATDENLWTETPASEPWKYGVGDGSSTMVLPDYRNRFIEGGDNALVIAAGLPNIQGAFNPEYRTNASGGVSTNYVFENASVNSVATGAFKIWTGAEYVSRAGDGKIAFDASASNPIYGKAETVQPPSLSLIPQIKF